MSSIEQLIVIYLDNRSVFHKDNFFFSLDFFVLFYENRFYMPLHNWILQIALIALKIGSNETNVVSEENVLLIRSINQFRNYELWIFMSFMTNQNNFLQLCLATCYCCCFCPKNLIGFLNFFWKFRICSSPIGCWIRRARNEINREKASFHFGKRLDKKVVLQLFMENME